VTPYFPAAGVLQMTAHNAAGAFGLLDVSLPAAFEPRATIDVPDLTMAPSRGITIDYQAPASGVALDAQIFLHDARVEPARRAEAARMLSVLDRLDPRLLFFFLGIRPLNINAGKTTIPGLPPFDELDVHVMGALTSTGFDRTLHLSGEATALAFRSSQILPPDGKAPLKGVVVIGNSYAPIKDATVTYSCYPDKVEVKTNENGEFGIPGACANRDGTVVVTAQDWIKPPRFASGETRVKVRPNAGAAPVVITIPPLAQTNPRAIKPPDISPGTVAHNRNLQKPYYTPVQGSRLERWFAGQPLPSKALYLEDGDEDLPATVYIFAPGTTEVNDVTEAVWIDEFHVKVTVSLSGKWQVYVAATSLIVGWNPAKDLIAGMPTVIDVEPLRYFKSVITVISAYGPWGCANCSAFLTNPTVDPDPTEVDLNQDGAKFLGTVDNPVVHVYVDAPQYGYYDCDVRLDHAMDVNVFLLRTADTACPTLEAAAARQLPALTRAPRRRPSPLANPSAAQ
jgi:hypothetical protein